MKSKTTRLFRPFPFLILFSLIFAVTSLWLIKKGLNIYNFSILLLCVGYIINWKVVKLYENKCEFFNHFLFIKYKKQIIEVRELSELFLVQLQDVIDFQSNTPRGYSINKSLTNTLLLLKNSDEQLIFIMKSMHYNNLFKISKLFSEYHNISIKRKMYFGDLNGKNFVLGAIVNDFIEAKRLNDYKEWRDSWQTD